MPPRQRPPDTRRGDRHTPRGCPEAPGGLIRVPQSHVDIWSRCRQALSRGGPLVTNAEMLRWLLETAQPFVERMLPDEPDEGAEAEAAVDHEAQEAWGAEGEREVRGKSLASSFIVMDERERRIKGDPGKEGRNLLGATADEIYMGGSNSGGPDEMKNGARTGTLVAMITVKTKFPGMKKDWIEFSFDSSPRVDLPYCHNLSKEHFPQV
ncbi:hypothetical protein R1sor_002870 [Riccia sorocarpa]|uniref:Uncharacterized protein n=1 Tax=Riccia sorocarpa TaxID=122646 RepID=A0ABD3H0U0_9MARC